jgi:hypothetical protein
LAEGVDNLNEVSLSRHHLRCAWEYDKSMAGKLMKNFFLSFRARSMK